MKTRIYAAPAVKGLNWFTDYLSEKSQSVIVEGKHTENLPVTSGVPQVSILGPLPKQLMPFGFAEQYRIT